MFHEQLCRFESNYASVRVLIEVEFSTDMGSVLNADHQPAATHTETAETTATRSFNLCRKSATLRPPSS